MVDNVILFDYNCYYIKIFEVFMDFLYFLSGLRFPLLNNIMLIITKIGEETVFLVVALAVFWCISKKSGYYLLSVGFCGMLINQFLKIVIRIERPWIRDTNFVAVEDAKAAAEGYSFPSGHTQNAAGTFGSIARFYKNNLIRIICVIIIALVAFSRMYLGVHTPADVITSIIIALILIFGIYPLFMKFYSNTKVMYLFLTFFSLISFAFILFLALYNFPEDTDTANLLIANTNAYTLLGTSLGITLAYFIEGKFVKFKESAPLIIQIIKTVLGLSMVLLIKDGLKILFNLIIPDSLILRAIRYFITVVVAIGIYPMLFKYLNKIKLKRNK